MSTRRTSRRKEHLKTKRRAVKRRAELRRKKLPLGPAQTPPNPNSTRSKMRAGLWRAMKDFAQTRAEVIAENLGKPQPLSKGGKKRQSGGHRKR